MASASLITIPARRGKATHVNAGQSIRVINTHGQQVVDTWAFRRDDLTEFMSMEHSRTSLGRIMPELGQSMTTNRRRPILTLAEDTSGGIHDTLLAACDRYRYELLGCEGYHDNCTDNLAAALAELGLTAPETPSPWNLFMNIPVGTDGSIGFEPPVCGPGDYVTLRAEMDCIIDSPPARRTWFPLTEWIACRRRPTFRSFRRKPRRSRAPTLRREPSESGYLGSQPLVEPRRSILQPLCIPQVLPLRRITNY